MKLIIAMVAGVSCLVAGGVLSLLAGHGAGLSADKVAVVVITALMSGVGLFWGALEAGGAESSAGEYEGAGE